MPYLSDKRKQELDEGRPPINTADLDYLFLKIAAKYCEDKGVSAATIIEVVGSLETTKLEFYRRIGGPYEENKITQNGDMIPERVVLQANSGGRLGRG